MKPSILALAAAVAALLATSANATHLPPANLSGDGGRMSCEPDKGAASNPVFVVASDWGTLTLKAKGTHPKHNDPRQQLDWCSFLIRFTGNFELLAAPGLQPGGGLANWQSAQCVVPPGQSCETEATTWWLVELPRTVGIVIEYELLVNGAVVAKGKARVVDPPAPGHEGEALLQAELPA